MGSRGCHGRTMSARWSGPVPTDRSTRSEKLRLIERAARSVDMSDQAWPEIRDVPIGIEAAGLRRETDSMGEIEVPADRYWGAQTQRSLVHFSIGDDRMPKRLYHAYGYVKKAAALINGAAGRLPPR